LRRRLFDRLAATPTLVAGLIAKALPMPKTNTPLTRRDFTRALALATANLACSRLPPTTTAAAPQSPSPTPTPARSQSPSRTRPPTPSPTPSPSRSPATAADNATAPVAFISHGAPTLAANPVAGTDLRNWGRTLPAPRAILTISAHWQTAAPILGTTTTRDLIYDFSGFPPHLYKIPYKAPGAPDLARRVTELLSPNNPPKAQPTRGWDHGVWVPLLHLYPDADIPLLQLSLPHTTPQDLFNLGRRLAPLRREGVLLIASGGLTHNLGLMGRVRSTPQWALDFDAWVVERLQAGDIDGLVDYPHKAPALRLAHPTEEHWTPMMVALGAATGDGALPKVRFPVQGWEYAHLSRRSVQFG